jgi:beta-glucanase (GH16 family)
MSFTYSAVAFLALLCTAIRGRPTSAAHPETSTERPWVHTWSGEFNGPDHSRPDPAKWRFSTGGNGWGNHELEYYTERPENSFIRDGNLVIRAVKERFTGPEQVSRDYTSARLTTKGLFAQAYGRFEARIKIPQKAAVT